jgi:hypothetical protein
LPGSCSAKEVARKVFLKDGFAVGLKTASTVSQSTQNEIELQTVTLSEIANKCNATNEVLMIRTGDPEPEAESTTEVDTSKKEVKSENNQFKDYDDEDSGSDLDKEKVKEEDAKSE